MPAPRPTNLRQLRESGWKSKSVKQEIHDNFLRALADGEELFPGVVGYEETVIPEINLALLAGHDMLFLGEKGQGKSRLMRSLVRFLDEAIPYLDAPGIPLHDDPFNPITSVGKRYVEEHSEDHVNIGWWRRDDRYAERLAPGTKFADVIGEIDPSRLASGVSMSTEEALHFGLIPRLSLTNWCRSACSTSWKSAMCKFAVIRCDSISTCWFCFLPTRRPTTAAAR
jgi:magnesium chelatase subunit I